MPDRIPTLADVCRAIAEGHLAVSSDGYAYEVSAFELRRYFSKRRPLSPLALVPILAPSSSDAHLDPLDVLDAHLDSLDIRENLESHLVPSADLCRSGL